MPNIEYDTSRVYPIWFCPMCDRCYYKPGKENMFPANHVPIKPLTHEPIKGKMRHLMELCGAADADEEQAMRAQKTEQTIAGAPEGYSEWIR